jgi:hypothetical protein
MSPEARVALTVVCVVLSGVAELAGIALLVLEARRAGRALRGWREAGDDERAAVLERVATAGFDRTAAVALLVLGVVAGALGDLLAL